MSLNGKNYRENSIRAGLCGLALLIGFNIASVDAASNEKEQIVKPTGLFPLYPKDSICPVLSSLFGSMSDVDGSKRKTPHIGVDGGKFGDLVIAPADGRVVAVWKTNAGSGMEWSVLLAHNALDTNSSNDEIYHLSEFNHLDLTDISHLKVGARLRRGEKVGRVRHPGGDPNLQAETHWEVYELPVGAENDMSWIKNEFGYDVWRNKSAKLVDPLYMLSLNQKKSSTGEVRINSFIKRNDYSAFKGFTYIFECKQPPAQN